MDKKTLGTIVQEARRKKGLTQQQLAHEVGVSHVTICHIELDRRFSIKILKNLAETLGLDFDRLYDIKYNSYNPPEEKTRFQMCTLIDKWFVKWENKIIKDGHKLALAKEELKEVLTHRTSLD